MFVPVHALANQSPPAVFQTVTASCATSTMIRMHSDEGPAVEHLSSGVLTSPADRLLLDAVAAALKVVPDNRAIVLAERLDEIKKFMAERPHERPWTFSEYIGTDGSRIFRGGIGHSLVVDPRGELWRARSYEDFETSYTITGTNCHITSVTPLYEQMRRYSEIVKAVS